MTCTEIRALSETDPRKASEETRQAFHDHCKTCLGCNIYFDEIQKKDTRTILQYVVKALAEEIFGKVK